MHARRFYSTCRQVLKRSLKSMKQDSVRSSLSKRELQIARAYASGKAYRDIAEELFIAPATVRTHISAIYRKLEVSSKVALLRYLEEKSNVIGVGSTGHVDPVKLSIAVLPFVNLSGDVDEEYFSDGITEDVITALSRLRWLFVIARNSTFTYKGREIDVRRIGREMGVRYVLAGSVRKAGNRVRVTAQLILAEAGVHVWAERYDRNLTGIFELQDELTEAISASIDAELAASERRIAQRKHPTLLSAWEIYQRGQWHYYKYGKDDIAEARRLFRRATDKSPEFASAFAGLAYVAYLETVMGYVDDPNECLQQGLRDAERAMTLDDRDPYVHLALGRVCQLLGKDERAIAALENALDLNPSSAVAQNALGQALLWFGRADEALHFFTRAMHLSPRDATLWSFYFNRGVAHFCTDELESAIHDLQAAISVAPNEFWPRLVLAASYSLIGKDREARRAYDEACPLAPELSENFIRATIGNLHRPYLESFLREFRNIEHLKD